MAISAAEVPESATGFVPPAAPGRPANVEFLITTHRMIEHAPPVARSLEVLHEDLFDARTEVALSALSTVEKLGNASSFPHVVRLISGTRQEIRPAAVRALGGIHHPQSARILREVLNSASDEKLVRDALGALASTAPADGATADAIRRVLNLPTATPAMKSFACGLFLKVTGVAGLEELLPGARGDILSRIVAVASEAPAFQPQTVSRCAPVFSRLGVTERSLVASMAARRELPESLEILRSALSDPSVEVRRAVFAALGTEPHQSAWLPELTGLLTADAERNPAIEDEAIAAILRLAKLSRGSRTAESRGPAQPRRATDPRDRAAVMATIMEAFTQLEASDRRISSDAHELGWLIVRSREYVEYYGDEDFKSALLRWLRGSSTDSQESMMKRLKETASRVEVRHFDGFSAVAELIKIPKRSGMALVARELALVKTGKNRILRRLIRAMRVALLFLTPAPETAEAVQFAAVYQWAKNERLFRLAEAALAALSEINPAAARVECDKCVTVPLTSKILTIAALHLLRDLRVGSHEATVTELVSSQDDPYVTMNALESIPADAMSASGELAKAALTRFAVTTSREVRDALSFFLAERVAVDITESLKEQVVSKDPALRAAALATLERRISNGLVSSRDGMIEFLFRLLRNEDEPSRRSAAIMLLKLGDEYAADVLRDFLTDGNDEARADILRRLKRCKWKQLFPCLHSLLRSESRAVHDALRELITGLESPEDSNLVLQAALESRGGSEEDDVIAPEPIREDVPHVELHSERTTFKFERENMQELVMFFSDIQGYSKKAQLLAPMELSSLIADYEKILLSQVEGHGGELVKRMGDGHMFVFRDPVAAVLAAIRLQKTLRRFNRYREENTRVVIRIGIHSGKVVRKNTGDVLGNAVNIASRLESSATPGSVLISEQLHANVKDFVHVREIGKITVKNISTPIKVFEPYEIVIDLPAAVDPLRQAKHEYKATAIPSEGVSLEANTYRDVVRCITGLVGFHRPQILNERDDGLERLIALWENLKPRLPAVPGI